MAEHIKMTSEPRLDGPEEDIREIRRLHQEWWGGNHGVDIERMRQSFAPDTLMWNLNSHPYYGLDEMIKVWEFYRESIDNEVVPLWDLRITVDGDMAYLTCEGILPFKPKNEKGWNTSNVDAAGDANDEGRHPFRFRETSVFRRDDGEGNKAWKMWHFHCSPLCPVDEPRPGIGDTWEQRGGDKGGRLMMD